MKTTTKMHRNGWIEHRPQIVIAAICLPLIYFLSQWAQPEGKPYEAVEQDSLRTARVFADTIRAKNAEIDSLKTIICNKQ